MGDWTDRLRQEATTRVVAEVEAQDAGMVCTENEVLYVNASGVQRAPLAEISKVSRDGTDLVINGPNSTFIRGAISLDKLTLMNFFAEVRQASSQARARREVLLDASAAPQSNPLQPANPTLNLPSQPTASISSHPEPVAPNPGFGRAVPQNSPVNTVTPPPLSAQPFSSQPLAPQNLSPAPGAGLPPRMTSVSASEIVPQFRPAGFWWRALASILDGLILGTAGTVLLVILGGGSLLSLIAAFSSTGGLNDAAALSSLAGLVGAYLFWSLLVTIGSWLYYALLESSERQATLGKMVAGVFVSKLDGSRISFGQASGRYWSKVGVPIAVGLVVALISAPFRDGAILALLQLAQTAALLYTYVMCAITPTRQTLYDQISGTLVWKR